MISFLKDLSVQAGQICLEKRRSLSKNDLEYKSPRDLVTSADKAVEAYIIEQIGQHYPDHGVFGEESGHHQGASDFRWIIDPIDGTTSFFHDQPFYSVSIALEQKGEIILGAVYAPALDQLFYAQKGKGAFLNDSPIRVSETTQLDQALLATGFACLRDGREPNNLFYLNRLLPQIRDIRRFGSAAIDLCYVACGKVDGFWEMNLNLYDIAAGTLIVQEAGGRVSDFTGGTAFPEKGIVAAGPAIFARLIENLDA